MLKKRPPQPETGSVQDVVSRESKKFFRLYKSHVLSKMVLTIIGIGFAGYSGWSMYQDKQKNGKGADHIAVIRIHGEMGTGTPTGDGVIIARALREAWDNPHAKAILIDAESGGGGPSDAINIYREINALRASLHGAPGLTIDISGQIESSNKNDTPPAPADDVKQALLKALGTGNGKLPATARDVRPIIVSIKNMCASACYYAASSADAIYADPNAIIGSIGVRMDHWDVSRIMDRLGVANEPLTAGAYKASLDPWRPIDDETKAFLHSELLDKMHEQFIHDVESGRKGKLLSREQADKELLYTGRFWLGDRAKQFGLIDDTATSTEVRERLSIVYGTTRFRDYNAPKATLSSMLGLSLDVNLKETLSGALNTTSPVR
ncbi:S49 family peptidase [Klebsiella sp. CN_Kp091]|uniref:S49 family peptidase n=1 Tax=unclassified Klebsiella TaxID=2608929 RepID=UPI0032B46893